MNTTCPTCANTFVLPEQPPNASAIVTVCPECGTYLNVEPRSLLGFKRKPIVTVREKVAKK